MRGGRDSFMIVIPGYRAAMNPESGDYFLKTITTRFRVRAHARPGMTKFKSTAPREAPHHFVELLEVAVADLHRAAGVAVIDADVEPERIRDALLERDGVGILCLAGTACLLRLALRYAFDMRERLGLAHVEALLDDLLGSSQRIGHADQRAGVPSRQLTGGDIGLHF